VLLPGEAAGGGASSGNPSATIQGSPIAAGALPAASSEGSANSEGSSGRVGRSGRAGGVVAGESGTRMSPEGAGLAGIVRSAAGPGSGQEADSAGRSPSWPSQSSRANPRGRPASRERGLAMAARSRGNSALRRATQPFLSELSTYSSRGRSAVSPGAPWAGRPGRERPTARDLGGYQVSPLMVRLLCTRSCWKPRFQMS
jgi:hypothetical protein